MLQSDLQKHVSVGDAGVGVVDLGGGGVGVVGPNVSGFGSAAANWYSQCPYFDVLIQRSRQALSCEALHHRP